MDLKAAHAISISLLYHLYIAVDSHPNLDLPPPSLPLILTELTKHYGPNIGRNFYELLRAYDALQVATYFRVVVPCNWGAGQ